MIGDDNERPGFRDIFQAVHPEAVEDHEENASRHGDDCITKDMNEGGSGIELSQSFDHPSMVFINRWLGILLSYYCETANSDFG